MGNLEPGLGDRLIAVEQQVEVECPRPMGRYGAAVAAERSREAEQGLQQLAWRELRLQLHCAVEKSWLFEVPDGLRVPEGRDGRHLCPRQSAEPPDRSPERPLAIAEV